MKSQNSGAHDLIIVVIDKHDQLQFSETRKE